MRFIATHIGQDGFNAAWNYALESNYDDAATFLADIAGKKRVWAKLKDEVRALNEQRFLPLFFVANLDDTAKAELLDFINEQHGASQVDIISPSGSFLDAARFALSTQNPLRDMNYWWFRNKHLLTAVLVKNSGKLFERRLMPLLKSSRYARNWTARALVFTRLSPNPDVALRIRQIFRRLPDINPNRHDGLLYNVGQSGDIEFIDIVISKTSPNLHKVLEGCASCFPENIDTFLHYIDQLPSGATLGTGILGPVLCLFYKPLSIACLLSSWRKPQILTVCELRGVWNDYVAEARSEDATAEFYYAADLKAYRVLKKLVNAGLIEAEKLTEATELIMDEHLFD
jgi:hypothetical protein